jgi:hypothetical protein
MVELTPKTPQIVISASRRTDIPAFYLPWFMKRIERGYFNVTNPYNQTVKQVPADPESVHTIVFWSKDFSHFLKENTGEILQKKGYHLFFNFTVNSASPLLEPHLPRLDDRLDQLDELGHRFGPAGINWRFDPVCFYQINDGVLENNLTDFSYIAGRAGKARIRRCITSFMDHYTKISRRLTKLPGLAFIDPPAERKSEILWWMHAILCADGIALQTCCEKDIIDRLPRKSGIGESACIPNSLLAEIYGGHISLRRDPGQRRRLGCGCQVSVDIGSYRHHPCGHSCLYCYANPIRNTFSPNIS